MYKIKKNHHYYAGSYNTPQDRYINQSDLAPYVDNASNYSTADLVFATKEEAQKTIELLDNDSNGTYYLAHGEYSSPDYTISYNRTWTTAREVL